jgi:threonine dehydrogenase-like Zn-dependent dehydrogenase
MLTQILRRRGVQVAASEPYPHKRALAEKWGAQVFDPGELSRSTHGKKTYADQIKEEFGEADAVFEMVGSHETLLDAIDLVRPGFRVLIFGAQTVQLIPYETLPRRIRQRSVRFAREKERIRSVGLLR